MLAEYTQMIGRRTVLASFVTCISRRDPLLLLLARHVGWVLELIRLKDIESIGSLGRARIYREQAGCTPEAHAHAHIATRTL